jgi:hypothetical protein
MQSRFVNDKGREDRMNVSKIAAAAVLVTSGALALGGCSATAQAGKAARTVTAAKLSESQRITRAVSADCAAYRSVAAKIRQGTAGGNLAATLTAGGASVLDDWARPLNLAVNRNYARWRVPQGRNAARSIGARLALIASVAGLAQLDADLHRSQALTLNWLHLGHAHAEHGRRLRRPLTPSSHRAKAWSAGLELDD